MQSSRLSSPKTTWLFVLIIGVISIGVISSCNGKGSKEATCVQLTKAQIQNWVNKGYTDSTGRNHMVGLRFRSAWGGPGGNTVFRVFVVGYRIDGSVINESLTELKPVDTCNKTHIKLSQYVSIGEIPLSVSLLKILKADGTIVDGLKALEMVPFEFYDDKYSKLYLFGFQPYTVKGDGTKEKITYKGLDPPPVGLPCPPCPNCPDPCPPPIPCVAPCRIVEIDSLLPNNKTIIDTLR